MPTVCLGANTLRYPQGGGHQWVFLNWARGFQANGCDVIWLETCNDETSADLPARLEALKRSLAPFGLADRLALCSQDGGTVPACRLDGCLDLDAAASSDLLLNVSYRMHPDTVARFRRSALLDIDPGLLQRWVSRGELQPAPYDLYFTIGETVGRPEALFPDAGIPWIYTPPCVALDWWTPSPPATDAAFTTVAHWYQHEWVEDDDGRVYENNKRSGFVPYFDLPSHVGVPLELALCLGPGDEKEQERLEARGWHIRHAHEVSSTPADYRQYIQQARGEFSGAKPSCVRLQNAWISDRTLCFLASGKPAIVQHTGPSRFLPDTGGLFRFHNLDEAARCLETAVADYEQQCVLARSLAEEHFDAATVTARVLERALA